MGRTKEEQVTIPSTWQKFFVDKEEGMDRSEIWILGFSRWNFVHNVRNIPRLALSLHPRLV